MGEGDKPKPGGPGPGDDTPAVGNAPDAAPANTAADIMDARGEDLSGSDSDHSDFEKIDMPAHEKPYVAEEYAAERARNPSGGGEKHKVRHES